ncbi:MAG: DinB family protein [Phycisphaerae bacterium]
MNDALIATITHTRNQTLKLVADLTDEQMVRQPAPGTNHPAWVLGHLLFVEHNFLKTISDGQGPSPDPSWNDIYGMKSVPVADPSKYQPKSFYIEKLAELRTKILARLKEMTAGDFSQPHPDPARRERFPSIMHAVLLYGTWHEAYHAGQLSAWRRVQGLPPV